MALAEAPMEALRSRLSNINRMAYLPPKSELLASKRLISENYPVYILHRQLGNSLDNPYFNYTHNGEKPYRLIESEGHSIKIGPIGSFSNLEMASFVQTLAESYTTPQRSGVQTMGDFPKENLESQVELMQGFIDGFSPDSYIVLTTVGEGISRRTVGGCLLTLGKDCGDLSLNDLVGFPGSCLSTLQSLDFKVPEQWLGDFKNTMGKNCFEVSRFFKDLQFDGQNSNKIVHELLFGITLAREGLEKRSGRKLSRGIADVSDKAFLRLVNSYGWKTVTNEVTPTKQISNSIWKHHYCFFAPQNKITVIMANANEIAESAQENYNTFVKGIEPIKSLAPAS